ncbi:beta-galactosidase [Microbacterium sp. EYE_5]|uniref:beta-galactosidase n=1 Tax=unclassified Microbacterium TaxID=2609290 RepID=UPI0020053A1F|nr:MULTISPECIES: beta-galactosidase [unclassified Microbacterium]MCK6079281.1 beta-galactosidase [Microbacterium sp. EYE_382]MCK6084551.1 beta-galactosidase [Microbacterium sp. EYE_384]MCK6123220.1 beta-galactosidase [Microbacterium sp. EYE_80]MCK6125315.1 beta-galactosidase [Microbacterium sp. EYE_79]MCK6140235.1 beta-galactosidase [Microbacterium sp. EYE_39]
MTRVHALSVPTPAAAEGTGIRPSAGDDSGVDVTAQSVRRAGRPIFPISGEIHYSRIPRERWMPVLTAARAGGLTHVSTYVLWNHHEPDRGRADFSGGLDVRAFLETARDAGLGLILRIGPYAHAEARHGGLPDWLVDSGLPLRTNDPAYLAEVERWYALLAEQVRGIPFFSIQVDNELYDGADHLTTLREMAEGFGMRSPIWTATGWGGAQLPEGCLPVYGGYPESFWVDADVEPDLRSHANFYPSPRRDDDSIGADHRDGAAVAEAVRPPHPFTTCELGSGMTSAYHRRLDVPAADVAAIAMAKLASGSVWQGYYMYADGRNPRRGLQESHAADGPNDFPEIAYDFGAPVQTDGAPRASWAALRRQHLLLERWGSALAAMPATFPDDAVDAPDVTGLRWAVRSDGASGFVFVVNRHPGIDLPAHDGVRFEIGETVFPGVDIPSGAVFAWPFGMPLGGVNLHWLTAQPVTEVTWRDAPLLVAAATAGIPPQLSADADVVEVGSSRGRMWELARDARVVARVLALDEADADAVALAGGRLVWAPGAVVTDDGAVTFAGDAAAAPRVEVLHDDGWSAVDVALGHAADVAVTLERSAGAPPTGAEHGGRASIPRAWDAAAVVTLAIEPGDDRTLRLEWTGDVARAWAGDRLAADALWTGRPWRIPAEARGDAAELRIEILPGPPHGAVRFPAQEPVGAAVTRAELEPSAKATIPRR